MKNIINKSPSLPHAERLDLICYIFRQEGEALHKKINIIFEIFLCCHLGCSMIFHEQSKKNLGCFLYLYIYILLIILIFLSRSSGDNIGLLFTNNTRWVFPFFLKHQIICISTKNKLSKIYIYFFFNIYYKIQITEHRNNRIEKEWD